MLNIFGAANSVGQKETQNGKIRRQSLREDQLSGLPKSTGRKDNMNNALIDKRKSQPLRRQDLLGSLECKESTEIVIEKMKRQPFREHELLGPPKSTGKKENMNNTITDKPKSQPVRIKDLFGSSECKESTKIVTEKIKRQPLREHELLGLPKSTGKKNNMNNTIIDKPKSQPVRIKDLFGSSESKESTKIVTEKIRRQPLREHELLGLSKSTGKKDNTNNTMMDKRKSQPVRMKDLFGYSDYKESTKTVTEKIRREPPREYKLLDLPKSTGKKDNMNNTIIDKRKSQRLRIKNLLGSAECKESTETVTEKIRRQPPREHKLLYLPKSTGKADNMNSTIIEEPKTQPVRIEDLSESSKCTESIKTVTDERMGVSVKAGRKENGNESNEEKVSTTITSKPLKELSQNSMLLPPTLDAMNNSLEDLLGNASLRVCDESFYYENLPRKSFLEPTTPLMNSLVNVKRETLYWLHENMKLNVQLMEEQLFSMKRVLKTIEDIIKNDDNSSTEESEPNIKTNDALLSLIPGSGDCCIKNVVTEPESCQDKDDARDTVEVPASLSETAEPVSETSAPLEKPNSPNLENNEESPFVDNLDDQDKENRESGDGKSRRCLLRLAKKMSKSPTHFEDSFSRLEKELQIIHTKAKKNTPLNLKTGKRFDPRSRRPIREYMAMKSTINFLDTPDIKGFPTPMIEKDTPLHRRIIRRSLSRKLLTELDDLYAESPT